MEESVRDIIEKMDFTADLTNLGDITSPSQLQELTLDQDYSFSLNSICLRSPGQTRGRSVKEIEEQLGGLKKENFNLKLRIYFLEERMGSDFTLDKENVIKKNIELNVEIESLKKELHEKHDLLCQAVKAMELEEDEHKTKNQEKEDQIAQFHQEIEDLKLQMQDMRVYESDLKSNHSEGTNNAAYFTAVSAQAFNLPDVSNMLQDKVQQLEEELIQEKENSVSLQVALEQSGKWKAQCEDLQSELDKKNSKISSLNDELHKLNDKFLRYHDKITDLESKYENLRVTNENLNVKLQEKNKVIDEILSQLQELRKKYTNTKVDLEREHKRIERMKMLGDMKVSELEEDNEKYKMKVRELQGKLEGALMDVKKNQNLAVSKSSVCSPGVTNTDVNLFSVQNPAASFGTPKKDSLHVSLALSPSSISPSVIPPSPDVFNLRCLDDLLQENGENISAQLIEQLQLLKNDYGQQKQQIVRLKAEQIKACKIIQTMISSRNKDIQENNSLKATVQKLEKELEGVVCKPNDCQEHPAPPPPKRVLISPDIEGGDSINTENTMTDTTAEGTELAEHYKVLSAQLEEKVQLLIATMKEKDTHMGALKERYEELLQELRERENKIVDLEFEMLSSSQNNAIVKRSLFSEKSDILTEKDESFYQNQLEEKDKEIEKLNSELRKRTCDLQQIVNKELWERNRHIEKLENRHAIALENKQKELLSLKSELSGKDLQLKVLTDKISELGIDIDVPKDHIDAVTQMDNSVSFNMDNFKMLQEQLKSALEERNYFQQKLDELQIKVNNSSDDEKIKFVDNLKSEFNCLQKNYEESEKLRFETNEICSVLSSRLEELAIFLDSLLKQKSVLGFLGSKENTKLRKIIDHSLDLSRTFTMSLLINPDQSLVQLSNLTCLLNDSDIEQTPRNSIQGVEEQTRFSIVPGNITLTYQSHLYPVKKSQEEPTNNAQIIETLRQQIQNLKYELQLRDVELNKLTEKLSERETTDFENAPNQGTGDLNEVDLNKSKLNTSSTLKCQSEAQSESEAWSEPDRSVSKARIGLNIPSKSITPSGKRSKLTTLSSDTTEEDDTNTSSNQTPSSKKSTGSRQTIVDLHKMICELEEKLLQRDTKVIAVEESNFELRSLLNTERVTNANLKEQLITMEEKIKSIQTRSAELEKQKNEADAAIIHLQRLVEELQSEKTALENSVEKQNKDVQNKINFLEAEKTKMIKAAQDAEEAAEYAESENETAKLKLQKMHEDMIKLEITLKSNYDEKLNEVKIECNKNIHLAQSEINLLQETITKMEVENKKYYVKKSEIDAKVEESVKEYQNLIEIMQLKEQDYRNKLQDSQDKVNQLRNELDNSTLQYSESVLEKTKIANEKVLIEQELTKLHLKETELTDKIGDLHLELSKVKHNFQKQITLLQNQKSKLEVRISELESTNAELHNRLISLKTSRGDQIYSTSLPNNGDLDANIKNIPVNQLFYRRHLFDSQSDYTSEDQQLVDDQRERRRMYAFNQQINPNIPVVDIERCEANSSPDLGIESDHGRFSSLEANLNISRPLLPTLELTESMSNLLDGDNNQVQNIDCDNEHCCKKTTDMVTENNDLKRKLLRTRRALEETVAQLSLANQRKKQVEKTICKQIHKTSQVLRKAKANLDSGSETDVYKK